MINQLLRLGALIATGRFLKPRIRGLLILLVVWVILWFLHSEYVSYVELSENRSWVLQASLLKLLLYMLSVALYVVMVERPLWPKEINIPAPAKKTASDQIAGAKHPVKSVSILTGDDGFDFLRNKPRLKGSTEKLLDK